MYDRSSPFAVQSAARMRLPGAGSKVDFATSRLRQAILTCELFPGEQVSEPELGHRFSLGRAATRGALAHLAGEGFVEVRPRKGWRVAPIVPRQIRDLAAARRTLEPMLVHEPPPAEIVDKLEQIAGINRALLPQDDEAAIVTARRYDRDFLDTLAGAGNLWTARWLSQAWNSSERVVAFLEGAGGGRMQTPDRTRLAVALRDGDVETASGCIGEAVSEFERFACAGLMSLRIDLAPDAVRHGAGADASHARTKDQPSTGSAPDGASQERELE